MNFKVFGQQRSAAQAATGRDEPPAARTAYKAASSGSLGRLGGLPSRSSLTDLGHTMSSGAKSAFKDAKRATNHLGHAISDAADRAVKGVKPEIKQLRREVRNLAGGGASTGSPGQGLAQESKAALKNLRERTSEANRLIRQIEKDVLGDTNKLRAQLNGAVNQLGDTGRSLKREIARDARSVTKMLPPVVATANRAVRQAAHDVKPALADLGQRINSAARQAGHVGHDVMQAGRHASAAIGHDAKAVFNQIQTQATVINQAVGQLIRDVKPEAKALRREFKENLRAFGHDLGQAGKQAGASVVNQAKSSFKSMRPESRSNASTRPMNSDNSQPSPSAIPARKRPPAQGRSESIMARPARQEQKPSALESSKNLVRPEPGRGASDPVMSMRRQKAGLPKEADGPTTVRGQPKLPRGSSIGYSGSDAVYRVTERPMTADELKSAQAEADYHGHQLGITTVTEGKWTPPPFANPLRREAPQGHHEVYRETERPMTRAEQHAAEAEAAYHGNTLTSHTVSEGRWERVRAQRTQVQQPSREQIRAADKAERDAHQEAIDNGY